MTHSSRVICFMFYDWIRRISRHDSVRVMTVMDEKVMSHQRLGLWEDQGINIGLEGRIGGMLRVLYFPRD